jgi:hypothetical protein
MKNAATKPGQNAATIVTQFRIDGYPGPEGGL